jgi:hypothetical protein
VDNCLKTSFPRRRETSAAIWIPACAGMTVDAHFKTVDAHFKTLDAHLKTLNAHFKL